ncbi:dephospho-CoA kinase [Arcanobacterium haemolyticum]|nr:dephospho-CoA kinase [Arcanobacterium haemolyticum]
MLRLSLTGGIGAGKSTLSSMLAEMGAHIIDLDEIARGVLAPDTEGTRLVAERWPSVVRGGIVDRGALAAIVFRDAGERAVLDSITHPRTWQRVDELLDEYERTDCGGVAVVDLALLYGSGREYAYHANLVVEAEADVRLRRLVMSRGMSRVDAEKRIASQVSRDELAGLADVVVDNSGPRENLRKHTQDLWDSWVVPFAHNLAVCSRDQGRRAVPSSHEMGLILRRLTMHGFEVVEQRSVNLVVRGVRPGVAPDDVSRALWLAGFVRHGDMWVSANPTYEVVVRVLRSEGE